MSARRSRAQFRAAAEATARLAIPLHSRMGDDPAAAVAKDIAAVRTLDTPERMNQRMMAAWRGVFAAALEATGTVAAGHHRCRHESGPTGRARGRAAAVCRPCRSAPTPSGLEVFAPKTARRFDADLQTVAGLGPAQRQSASAALQSAIRELDGVRRGIRGGMAQRPARVPPAAGGAAAGGDRHAGRTGRAARAGVGRPLQQWQSRLLRASTRRSSSSSRRPSDGPSGTTCSGFTTCVARPPPRRSTGSGGARGQLPRHPDRSGSRQDDTTRASRSTSSSSTSTSTKPTTGGCG